MIVSFLSAIGIAALAAAAAMLLVLIVRPFIRRHFGPHVAYALWAIVPVATLVSLMPSREIITVKTFAPVIGEIEPVIGEAAPTLTPALTPALSAPTSSAPSLTQAATLSEPAFTLPDIAAILLMLWAIGALFMLAKLIYRQRSFMKAHAASGAALQVAKTQDIGPVAIGVIKSRIIVPADFKTRYSALERKLIIAHERAHIISGDMRFNLIAALIDCVFWFNPLVKFALQRFRMDQELACDARVMKRFGLHRRAYGEALLKTQFSADVAPLACAWSSKTLKARLEGLSEAAPGPIKNILGGFVAALMISGAAAAAWAAFPEERTIYKAYNDANDDTKTADKAAFELDSKNIKLAAELASLTIQARAAEALEQEGLTKKQSRDNDAKILKLDQKLRAFEGKLETLQLDEGDIEDIHETALRVADEYDRSKVEVKSAALEVPNLDEGELRIVYENVQQTAKNNDPKARGGKSYALLLAAKGMGRMRELLEGSGDVAAADRGYALVRSSSVGNASSVEKLISQGTDVNHHEPGEGTPLLVAAHRGHTRVLEKLLKAGADPNGYVPGDGTPLLVAARRGYIKTVTLLLDAGADPNRYAPGDGNALLAAAARGHNDIVALLLEYGADPNAAAPGDGNALITAARRKQEDIVRLLLEAGADPNSYVKGDETPLIGAAAVGHRGIAQLLLDAGADPNLAVDSGNLGFFAEDLRSPVGQAKRFGQDRMVALLLDAGARDVPRED